MSDIREVTQAELDNMVAGQRKFFMELVEQGRARIVSTSTPGSKDTDKRKTGYPPRDPPASPFNAMLNHEVKLLLVNGDVVTGKLVTVWQFEITLKTTFNEIVILKHAILSLELVS